MSLLFSLSNSIYKYFNKTFKDIKKGELFRFSFLILILSYYNNVVDVLNAHPPSDVKFN